MLGNFKINFTINKVVAKMVLWRKSRNGAITSVNLGHSLTVSGYHLGPDIRFKSKAIQKWSPTYNKVDMPVGIIILLELEGSDAELLLTELLRGRDITQ
jgi:hypothetical protein